MVAKVQFGGVGVCGGVYAAEQWRIRIPDVIRQVLLWGSPIHIPDMSGVTGPVLKTLLES